MTDSSSYSLYNYRPSC